MAIGWHIESILSAGTAGAITSEIYDGVIPQQGTYPAIQIDDFSNSEDSKDHCGPEYYTVTVMIWGDYKKTCDDIADACKVDLVGSRKIVNGTYISGIKFTGRQPWIRDKETKKWGRPLEFQVFK